MRIDEVESLVVDKGKLAALAEFLLSRAEDTNAKKTISAQTYINLAKNMGISLTMDQLRQMITEPPLSNLIDDVEGDETSGKIVFKGATVAPDTMTVDQARKTVDSMAKRAAKKNL